MASTPTKRTWWAGYQCQKLGPFVRAPILGLNPPINPLCIEAQRALGVALANTGYKPRMGTWAVQTYNCRQITGGVGYSLHAYGIAWDIDPAYNPYIKTFKFRWSDTIFTPEQIAAVEAIKTKNGKQVFMWGGRWFWFKDYMHFEIDVRPSDLKTGIDWSTVVGVKPEEEEEMVILKVGDIGPDVALWKSAINKFNLEKGKPWGEPLPEGDWFSPEMATMIGKYQDAAGITKRPGVLKGSLDLYTMQFFVEYTRED